MKQRGHIPGNRRQADGRGAHGDWQTWESSRDNGMVWQWPDNPVTVRELNLSFTSMWISTSSQMGKRLHQLRRWTLQRTAHPAVCLIRTEAETEQQTPKRRCRNRMDFTAWTPTRATLVAILSREAKRWDCDYTKLWVKWLLDQSIALTWHPTDSTQNRSKYPRDLTASWSRTLPMSHQEPFCTMWQTLWEWRDSKELRTS